MFGGQTEAWMDATHCVCLSSQISDKGVFNKSLQSFTQVFPVVGTLDSTAGKKDTVSKIHHISLLPHHEWPALLQVTTPVHKTASFFLDYG